MFKFLDAIENLPAPILQSLKIIRLVIAVFCGLLIINSLMTNYGVEAASIDYMQSSDFSLNNITIDGTPLNALEPAQGESTQDNSAKQYPIETISIDVETVLIPRSTTVISSSQAGKIKTIRFENGQQFKKGDVLVEYECKDLKAEVEIAKTQQKLATQKSDNSLKLFKLNIISNIEKLELESESVQAKTRIDLYQSRMDACFIRANYDGRVIKRLANAGEFTRTDRVLMEVASRDHLKAEFLLPSRWLRWVNIGAPLTISINETEKNYNASVQYIYGEVDPVSQSIQMTAQLSPYNDPLLPGMSGKATIDVGAIRDAGIIGFLETPSQTHRQ